MVFSGGANESNIILINLFKKEINKRFRKQLWSCEIIEIKNFKSCEIVEYIILHFLYNNFSKKKKRKEKKKRKDKLRLGFVNAFTHFLVYMRQENSFNF